MKKLYAKKFKYSCIALLVALLIGTFVDARNQNRGRGKWGRDGYSDGYEDGYGDGYSDGYTTRWNGPSKCRGWVCRAEISGLSHFRINVSTRDILEQDRIMLTSNFCVYGGRSFANLKLKWDEGTGSGYLENHLGHRLRYRLGVAIGANQSRPDYEFTRGQFSPARRLTNLVPCHRGRENMTLFLVIDGRELAGKSAGRYGRDQIKLVMETE